MNRIQNKVLVKIARSCANITRVIVINPSYIIHLKLPVNYFTVTHVFLLLPLCIPHHLVHHKGFMD